MGKEDNFDMNRLTKTEICLQIEVFLKKYPTIFIHIECQSANNIVNCYYFISARTLLNSVFPGLFQNVIIFIPRWPETQIKANPV